MVNDTRILPALDAGETYTDPDFLLVLKSTDSDGESVSEINRMFAAKREDDTGSWVCKTITHRTKMSHEAAMAVAPSSPRVLSPMFAACVFLVIHSVYSSTMVMAR